MNLKRFVLATLFALSLARAAEAEAIRQWSGGEDAQGAWLLYGTPETDDVVLGLFCDRAAKQLIVTYAFEPVVATEGVRVFLELFSVGVGEDGRSTTVLLEATGNRLLLNDSFLLEAKTTWHPDLRSIITRGEELSIMVEDGVEEIPLEGAAGEAAGLFEACG